MPDSAPRTARLFAEAIVWDNVFPLEPWVGNDLDALGKLRAAGFSAVSLTIAGDNHTVGEAVQRLAAARRQIAARPDFRLLLAVDDVVAAKREGKLAVGLHFEGTRCLERNLDMIAVFRELGVRHNLLAFNQGNSAGGGCGETGDGGLTRFGRRVVAEMQRVGMLVDLSHTGARTTLDAFAMATRPMVISHSNCRAVHEHWRNVTDEQIRACAATGGLVGLSGSSEYLGDPAASTEAMLRHVQHVADLVGPAHVGLGLDFVFDSDALNRWISSRPEEWPGTDRPDWPGFRYARPGQVAELVEALALRGWSDEALLGLLGQNHMRVCAAAWQQG